MTNTDKPTVVTEAIQTMNFYKELYQDLEENLALGDFKQLFQNVMEELGQDMNFLKTVRYHYSELMAEWYS